MGKDKSLLVLAVFLSLAAAATVYWYINNLQTQINNSDKYEEVIVAKEYIPAHTVIRGEMLQLKKLPLGSRITGAYRQIEDIVGKVSVTAIYAGQQPVALELTELGSGEKGISFALGSGKRAVTIAVDEVSAVGGYILPGNIVDVVATFNLTDKEGKQQIFNTYVIQKVRLLALGQEGTDSTRVQAAEQFSTATLEVSPEQVSKLALAADQGKVRLVLRQIMDGSYAATSAFAVDQFLP